MLTKEQSPFFRFLRYAHALFGSIFALLLLLLILNTWALTIFRVDGHSMDPTLHDGQVLLVNLLAYRQAAPARGDLVVVSYAGDPKIRFVKRIVAIPGDTIPGQDRQLGSDQYFIEGDNRDHSTDSRTFGPVVRPQIIGRVSYQFP